MSTNTRVYRSRLAVIAALRRNGGRIRSEGGYATALLAREAGREGDQRAFVGLLNDMEREGWIVRDTKAKRTFEIIEGDVPEYVEQKLIDAGFDQRDRMTEVFEEATAPEPAEDPADGVQSEPEATPDADAVASAILRQVVELLTAGKPDDRLQAERDEFSSRLAATVEENQRLRKQLREAHDAKQSVEDVALARLREVEGLRQRLAAAEANLKAAQRNARIDVDAEVRRGIETFMREAPRPGNA
jgi:hypothetical protein